MFKKATRETVWLKLGITGPSGSGKTTGALKLARGLVGDKGRIALIDTENGSASLYSDITEFDVCDLHPPFEDKKFSEAINFAASNGYDAVIIDSASHFWEAVLEYKDKLDKRGGNSFTNWREAGERFKEVLGAVLQSKIHVILCLRSKMEHAMEKDDRGRTSIKKVGMAPIMRDGIEYEFTVVFDLDMSHTASASKDRTRHFDGRFIQLTEEVGQQLDQWRRGDLAAPEPAKVTPQPAEPKQAETPKKAKKPKAGKKTEDKATGEQVKKIGTYFAALNIDDDGQTKAYKWAGSSTAKLASDLLKAEADKLIKELQRRMNEIPTGSNEEQISEAGKGVATDDGEEDVPYDFPSDLKWLEKDEDRVNPKLVEWGWIQEGETFRNLPADKVKKIKDRPAQFCKAVNIEIPQEAA